MKTELSLADLQQRTAIKKCQAAKTTIEVMQSRLMIPSRGWLNKMLRLNLVQVSIPLVIGVSCLNLENILHCCLNL
jgi:hypothetical protein